MWTCVIELQVCFSSFQSGELNAADLDPLLVYEMELRINERLAEDQEPLFFKQQTTSSKTIKIVVLRISGPRMLMGNRLFTIVQMTNRMRLFL